MLMGSKPVCATIACVSWVVAASGRLYFRAYNTALPWVRYCVEYLTEGRVQAVYLWYLHLIVTEEVSYCRITGHG